MPTVGDAYDKKYKKGRDSKMRTTIATEEDKKAKAKTMPKTDTPLNVVKKKAKKKKATGVIESIKGIARGLMKKTKERTGSESMYEKHEKRRKK